MQQRGRCAMSRPEPNAGPAGKSVERQKTKIEELFFEQQLQKFIENRETFANASEIARTYPGAELSFRTLKDNPNIRISEQILRSIWPTVHEWVYADFLAQIRFSTTAAWPAIIVRLLKGEGIEHGETVHYRRLGGRPRKAAREREPMLIGERVKAAIPRFERLHTDYDSLRRKFPPQGERWRRELNKAGTLPNEIDALMHSKMARSAAIHYVAMKLGIRTHTVQNAFSIYKKGKEWIGRVRKFPRNPIRETEIPQIPQKPRKG
jgi:hypothetical protein